MKKQFKVLTIFSLILLLSLTLVGAASADVLRGKGWVHAQGSGVANLRFSGHVKIEGHGTGVVYIYGAESIEAEGQGTRTDLHGGGVIFRGHEGTIKVIGRHMTVRMIGKKIEFTAQGKGTVYLRGRGIYETHGRTGDWAPDGFTIEVEEEE